MGVYAVKGMDVNIFCFGIAVGWARGVATMFWGRNGSASHSCLVGLYVDFSFLFHFISSI